MRLWRLLLSTLLLSQVGCSLYPKAIEKDPYGFAISREYNADFETTWAAVITAMEWYPILTIEKESGILVTDWVNGQSPNVIRELTSGSRSDEYGIGVLLMKMEADRLVIVDISNDSPAAKVGIMKGDIVISINNEPVSSISDFGKRIRSGSEVSGVDLKPASPGRFKTGQWILPTSPLYHASFPSSKPCL